MPFDGGAPSSPCLKAGASGAVFGDAFRAGYETGRMRNWFTRALMVEGSIGWAVQRMNEGKAVKRRNWQGFITKEDTLFLSSVDVHATDWELADTPDSPCDVP